MSDTNGIHVQLSLRVYFAGQALAGELASQGEDMAQTDQEWLARRCYAMADAMIKELNQTSDDGAYDHA